MAEQNQTLKGRTIKIGGKKRYFKAGTNATGIMCELRGMTFDEFQQMSKRMQDGKGMPHEFRDFLYSGLVAGAYKKGETPEFTRYDVGEWMDEMDQEELNKAFEDAHPDPADNKEKKTKGQGSG